MLQVGDLGYFPDISRVDSATRHHAARDPMELGVAQFNAANPVAGRFLQSLDPLLRLYFTAGNHEDFQALERLRRPRDATWPVDDFRRLWCVDDGKVATVTSGLRVAALWGIDGNAPKARRIRSPRAQIDPAAAERLASGRPFDVLLTHESPRDAIWLDSGSLEITAIIERVQPSLAFFGHYHTPGRLPECDFGRTRVYWMSGMELLHCGQSAEPGCAGVLTSTESACDFEYLPDDWLAGFRRDNWQQWL